MFNLGRFFYRAVALSEADAASSEHLPVFAKSEKTRHDIGPVLAPPPGPWAKHRKLPFIIKLLFLTSAFAFAFFFGQSIANYAALPYRVILQSGKAQGYEPCNQEARVQEASSIHEPIPVTAAAPWKATLLNRSDWDTNCSSKPAEDCGKAIDAAGAATDWTSDTIKAPDGGKLGVRHWIMIDLKKEVSVHSLAMTPSQRWSKDGGSVRKHQVQVSKDKVVWELVAFGSWKASDGAKFATFEPRVARFVNLSIIDSHKDKDFVAISDINIYTPDEKPPSVPNGGRWGVTLDLPIVPVTAFLNPTDHKLITMASFTPEGFAKDTHKNTFIATWDPETKAITDEDLRLTGHDMFCPGTSMDQEGRVMVTGGSTPNVFSVYSSKERWWKMPDRWSRNIKIRRGYQGQTFLPDGRTFMIGGAWSGGTGDKGGEIFNPNDGQWTVMANITAEFIKMDKVITCKEPIDPNECPIIEWRQHHPWLFAWKESSIFHAGPSKKMNWFFTNTTVGTVKDAGFRAGQGFADGDAVCGITSMYDAEQGLVLTAGGAPNYHYWLDGNNRIPGKNRSEATRNAFRMTLGEPGKTVKVEKMASMTYERIFANSVILPNGETLVIGGQKRGEPFHDDTWQPVPEIYSPTLNTWREVARHSIPRVYHSWALLLPDATVIAGGSGLSNPETNHYDAQIYEPAYLFTTDGKAATRPGLEADEKKLYTIGDKITLLTDVQVDEASLIRYSAATHALNNDLRRVKLTLVAEGSVSGKWKYSVTIPGPAGVTLPGYWMLFVLRNNVPSLARTIQIKGK